MGAPFGAAGESDLERQLFRGGSGDLDAAFEDRIGLGEWENEHARADARQKLQLEAH